MNSPRRRLYRATVGKRPAARLGAGGGGEGKSGADSGELEATPEVRIHVHRARGRCVLRVRVRVRVEVVWNVKLVAWERRGLNFELNFNQKRRLVWVWVG